MHEFSVTSQIVESIIDKAREQRASKVLEVHLVVGKLTFLGLEQVRFSYEILVKGTMMEDSKLYIEEKDPVVRCVKCGYRGDIKYGDDPVYHFTFPTLTCPKCGGRGDIVEGRECTIKTVKLVV